MVEGHRENGVVVCMGMTSMNVCMCLSAVRVCVCNVLKLYACVNCRYRYGQS